MPLISSRLRVTCLHVTHKVSDTTRFSNTSAVISFVSCLRDADGTHRPIGWREHQNRSSPIALFSSLVDHAPGKNSSNRLLIIGCVTLTLLQRTFMQDGGDTLQQPGTSVKAQAHAPACLQIGPTFNCHWTTREGIQRNIYILAQQK